ncbi:hypothetical protein Taro_052589, partial [Colocasia esculenta]|nr:hypothetical protein [Colocasia esculenta]
LAEASDSFLVAPIRRNNLPRHAAAGKCPLTSHRGFHLRTRSMAAAVKVYADGQRQRPCRDSTNSGEPVCHYTFSRSVPREYFYLLCHHSMSPPRPSPLPPSPALFKLLFLFLRLGIPGSWFPLLASFLSFAAPSCPPRTMASLKGLAGVAAVAILFHCALAASISVGGPSGAWDLSTDFATWAASQKFAVGDRLVFQYTAGHDVVEVTKTDFDNCNAGNPIKTYTGGNTVIALSAPGKRYFICGTPGHCAGGMKLEVDVVSAASSAPPTPSPAPPKASPMPPAASPAPPTASPATLPPKSAPSPRPHKKSPSPSPAPLKNSPSPSRIAPEPTAPAQPSDLPPESAPTRPVRTGLAPQPSAPSAAGGLKASAAAGFACGLLMLLAL